MSIDLDIVGYLETTEIDLTYSGNNIGPNDIAMECPFCDDSSNHLTIHRSTGYLNCWRCNFDEYKANNKKGWRPSFKALIKEIEQCSWAKAKEIYDSIGGDQSEYQSKVPIEQAKHVEKCVFPSHTVSFSEPNEYASIRDNIYNYILNRNFTKWHIEKYNLHFCAMGRYVGRVIIPYYKNNELVNWIGRRTSPLSKGRYLNCNIDECVIRLSDLLYGQETFQGDVLRLVEGSFDKMRLGNSTLALSRSQMSSKQRYLISQLSKNTKYISIILDPEAEKRALSIAEELSVIGKKIKIVQLPLGLDPANMSYEQIIYHENKSDFFLY